MAFFGPRLPGILLASLMMTGCAVTRQNEAPPSPLSGSQPARTNYGRSEYGHRPGPQGFQTVVIDAGHGGRDSGASSPYTREKEKDLALDTARRLAANLRGNFKVVMLRSSDSFVDLNNRVAQANRYPDSVLVSIHYNSSSPRFRGPETYYWRVDSHALAVRLQRSMSRVSSAGSSRGLVRRRLRLTRNPMIPSVLVECGYLSNKAESRKISGSAYRQAMANAMAEAILAQARWGDEGTGPLPRPINAPISRPTDPPE